MTAWAIVAAIWGICAIAGVIICYRAASAADRAEGYAELMRRAMEPESDVILPVPTAWGLGLEPTEPLLTAQDFPTADRCELIEAAAVEAFNRKMRGFGLL